jgi:hypothetical protein
LPEEGMVIGDMSKSLLDLWEEGTPFGELPFEKLEESEDLSRRWLLRHWFGGGREEDSLMKILTDKKPDPKELVSPFFRDALKLAIKVTMKPYLFKEMIWRDVTKLLDEQFEGDITWLREQLKKTENPEQRRQIFKKYATEEVEITEDGKTVMEGGKPKKRKRLTYDEWQKARKDRIDDYIIAWWWEGVISTHDFDSWAHTLVEYGEKEPLTIGAGVSFMPKELIPTWLEVVRVFGEGGIKLRKPFPITKLGAGLVGGVKKEVTVPADPRPNWINISIDPNP